MKDRASTRTFLLGEIEALEPFGFILIGPAENRLHRVEIGRGEDASLAVAVPGRPPILPGLDESACGALRERGFSSEDPADPARPWTSAVSDRNAAVALAEQVFEQVFHAPPDAALDVIHGSHRAQHEAEQKLAALRVRVEPVLTDAAGSKPEQDADGDYQLAIGDVRVVVSLRALPFGPTVVRVFAITNVGVNVVPELGLFLARLNFGLMFGRFALDVENRSVWFDETLLGQNIDEEALRYAIRVVAATADEWDDRLKQMFGGSTFQEVHDARRDGAVVASVKPGGSDPRQGTGFYI
jgi:hypothetical protein